ncbi:unnamed protein product [Paramecium octaurelia]|uniref:Uncharacterized protein n=1 Tax=Paramecium octaurelia TaxID=43137 RepID=A0A8S1X5I6_PAROT|nr:unnamed protein product [Paramecium octaurelia]
MNQKYQKFEIVNQQEKIDNESFKCFTINNDSTILIGCTWTVIYIYSLQNNGQMINTQIIQDQDLLINQVYFMKSGKTFITMGQCLSFWTLKQEKEWTKGNVINLQERISFLIFNRDETKMIISFESSLQFWEKEQSTKKRKIHFELELPEKATSMSLSESEKELLIGMQSLILLAKCQNGQKWQISYKVRTSIYSIWKMVVFLDQNMFVSSPSTSQNLIQYEWNHWHSKLIRIKKICLEKNVDISRENSISFQKEGKLLFHKFNKIIRIFSYQNKELQLQQSISFTNCENSFYVSRDCKYLIVRNSRGKGFSTWFR